MMELEKLARKGILDLAAYVPGKAIEEVQKEFKVKRWIKLASNENLLGPSPRAVRAIREELHNIFLYPEGPCTGLRRALARKLGLREENIVISNGADNLILMIANAFVDQGDEVVMAAPTFPVYTNTTQIMGGNPTQVVLKDFAHDLPRMLERITERTKLVYVCNPNNPTGTIVSQTALDDFLSKLPERVVLVLDEAYADFVEDSGFPHGLDYVMKGRQVIALRTFSKVYGLGGLRIGYALGREDLVKCLYQVRDPFPVHRLAQVAAEAALRDREHERASVKLVREGRRYLYKELDEMGLFYVPSQANFVFIDFGKDSREVSHKLLKEGIIIRPGHVWGYDTWGRVTVGRSGDNRAFIKALQRILKDSH
jgi:histidinol-phosphate aminotransferase